MFPHGLFTHLVQSQSLQGACLSRVRCRFLWSEHCVQCFSLNSSTIVAPSLPHLSRFSCTQSWHSSEDTVQLLGQRDNEIVTKANLTLVPPKVGVSLGSSLLVSTTELKEEFVIPMQANMPKLHLEKNNKCLLACIVCFVTASDITSLNQMPTDGKEHRKDLDKWHNPVAQQHKRTYSRTMVALWLISTSGWSSVLSKRA